MISSRKRYFLYLLSFTEGGAVMATELSGAKVLAPYFGNSLYVWASVMALTLGGLACGYFLGGRLSQRKNIEKLLMTLVLFAALYIFCLPFLSPLFIFLATRVSLLPAVLAGSMLVLFPPVFLLGMVSPMIIELVTRTKEESGKRAGEIYALSTFGGICFTFFTGFYTIPQWGLDYTLYFIALPMSLFPLVYFIGKRMLFQCVAFILLGSLSFFLRPKGNQPLYESDGLLGKLEVRDMPYTMSASTQAVPCRMLFIDKVIQSCMDIQTKKSKLEYAGLITDNLSLSGTFPKTALALGLGGGTLAGELIDKGVEVTAIELDERMVWVAEKYFDLDTNITVKIDDARHALYSINKKFDLVTIDLFQGEVTPWHVLSLESFTKIRSLLNDGGKIVINTYGYLKTAPGAGNLVLLKTLQQAGFTFKICYVGEKEQEDYRNFEIFASLKPLDQKLKNELEEKIPDLSTIPVNTDIHPVLEYANASAAEHRRRGYLRSLVFTN